MQMKQIILLWCRECIGEAERRGCTETSTSILPNHYLLKAQAKEFQFYHMDGLENMMLDFLGGTVDRNPPANAGHTGSVPGLGGFHTPQSN